MLYEAANVCFWCYWLIGSGARMTWKPPASETVLVFSTPARYATAMQRQTDRPTLGRTVKNVFPKHSSGIFISVFAQMQARQTINYWVFWFICLLISERSWRRRINPVSRCLGIYLKFHFIDSALHHCSDVFYGRPDGGSSTATELVCVCLCVSTVCSVFLAVFVCVTVSTESVCGSFRGCLTVITPTV